jgi:hypothetical protein
MNRAAGREEDPFRPAARSLLAHASVARTEAFPWRGCRSPPSCGRGWPARLGGGPGVAAVVERLRWELLGGRLDSLLSGYAKDCRGLLLVAGLSGLGGWRGVRRVGEVTGRYRLTYDLTPRGGCRTVRRATPMAPLQISLPPASAVPLNLRSDSPSAGRSELPLLCRPHGRDCSRRSPRAHRGLAVSEP